MSVSTTRVTLKIGTNGGHMPTATTIEVFDSTTDGIHVKVGAEGSIPVFIDEIDWRRIVAARDFIANQREME